MFVERGGGYAAVDDKIRAALRSAMVIPEHEGALVAAKNSTLRAIVLTQDQGALVHRIFYDDASGRWRRGRWHVEAGASSGKSYIAMHLSAQWATAADGGATLYLCHHARQQGVVAKQIACELRSVLGEGASVVAEECVGVRDATWVRTPLGAPREAKVLVATIDAVVDFAVIDTIANVVGGKRDVAARIAGFLKGAEVDLEWEARMAKLRVEKATVQEQKREAREARVKLLRYARGPRPLASCAEGHPLVEYAAPKDTYGCDICVLSRR